MAKNIIYQLLPRLWNTRGQRTPATGHFSDIDSSTLEYIKSLGVTHLWLTGVVRHSCTVSFPGAPGSIPEVVKGDAGSPYAIVDYYDVNPYLADNPSERMTEFEQTLSRVKNSGLKLIIDFVPNHVSRDYGKVALADKESSPLGDGDNPLVHWSRENDFYYYPGEPLRLPVKGRETKYFEYPAKASGNCFSPSPGVNDWYETIRLNYCDFHTSTWDKMYEIVRFWCLKGVDAFRCDMVEMVPWQFFKWLIARIKNEFPEVNFIAEVYSMDLYPLYIEEVGFDLLYDKSGMYDSLRAIVQGQGSAKSLTGVWQRLGKLQGRMLNFLENHDEQRFASDFFASDASRTFASLGASLLFNDSSFMIYSGEEIGERGMDCEGFSGLDGRTSIFDWCSPDSSGRLIEYSHTSQGLTPSQASLLERWRSLLNLSRDEVFSKGKTYDLGWCNTSGSRGFDPDRHFAFLRGNESRIELVICNFSSKAADIDIFIPGDVFSFFGTNKTETTLRAISVNADDCLIMTVL